VGGNHGRTGRRPAMRIPCFVRPFPARQGAALMVAVVALAVVSVVSTSVVWNCLAGRRLLDQRQHQLQAKWLARSGLELAAARLLAEPSGYMGESVELIPGAQVRVVVRTEQAAPN